MLYRPGTTIGLTFWEGREVAERALPLRMQFLERMTTVASVQIDEIESFDVAAAQPCLQEGGLIPSLERISWMAYSRAQRATERHAGAPAPTTGRHRDARSTMRERAITAQGDRWLDLACGTGAIAERAAAGGADYSLRLISRVRSSKPRRSVRPSRVSTSSTWSGMREPPVRGRDLRQDLFTLGIMFAPDHEAVARELARVTATGGRLALANWTPQGGLGKMFKVMAPYQPAPPSSPFDWGDESRVRELLGDAFDAAPRASPRAIPQASSSARSSSRRAPRSLADGIRSGETYSSISRSNASPRSSRTRTRRPSRTGSRVAQVWYGAMTLNIFPRPPCGSSWRARASRPSP